MNEWNADTEAGASELGAVTVVEGSSFCISSHTGDIYAGGSQGVFYQDTRIVSRWLLSVNGSLREPLVARTPAAFQADFIGRACSSDGRFDSPLVVQHERHVGPGLRDDITIRNYSSETSICDIELSVDADLADLFDVKSGRPRDGTSVKKTIDGELHVESVHNGQRRGVAFRAAGAHVREDALTFQVSIPPRSHWSTSVIVVPLIDGEGPEEPFTETAAPHHREGVRRHIARGFR